MRLRWPVRLLGPAPTLNQTATICWGFWFALLFLPLSVAALHQDKARIDADFVNFYMLGRMLNEHPHDQLYSYRLQRSVAEQIHPLKDGAYGPVAYPPATAVMFQPFAALPYGTAYGLWLLITMMSYASAIMFLGRSLFPNQAGLQSLVLCLSLSFFPFVIETLVSGQVTAVGFFALTMAILEERKQRPFASGIWLAVCIYKPTLLIWILPMLVLTKRWRAIAGFWTSSGAILSLTTAIAGPEVWSGYLSGSLRLLGGTLGHFGPSDETHFTIPFSKYVDITAFTSLLTHSTPGFAPSVFAAAALVIAATFGRNWRRSCNQDLVWASAISATLVVNLYTPIYDATLAVIGIMLTISGAWWKVKETDRSWLLILILAIIVVSWWSVTLAAAMRVQFMTLLLSGLGIIQYRALRDSAKSLDRGTRDSPAGQKTVTAPG